MKLENRFRKRLCDALVARYGDAVFIQKNHGNEYSSGLPDLFIQLLNWGGVHIELKAVERASFDWTQQPTKLQMSTLRKLHLAGARVGVILYNAEKDCSLAVHGAELFRMVEHGVCWSREDLSMAGVSALFRHPLLGASSFMWGRSVDGVGHGLANHVFGPLGGPV